MIEIVINLNEKSLNGLRPITDDYESGSVRYKENWCLIEVMKHLAGSEWTEEVLCKVAHVGSAIPPETTAKILQKLVAEGLVVTVIQWNGPAKFRFQEGAKLFIQRKTP